MFLTLNTNMPLHRYVRPEGLALVKGLPELVRVSSQKWDIHQTLIEGKDENGDKAKKVFKAVEQRHRWERLNKWQGEKGDKEDEVNQPLVDHNKTALTKPWSSSSVQPSSSNVRWCLPPRRLVHLRPQCSHCDQTSPHCPEFRPEQILD